MRRWLDGRDGLSMYSSVQSMIPLTFTYLGFLKTFGLLTSFMSANVEKLIRNWSSFYKNRTQVKKILLPDQTDIPNVEHNALRVRRRLSRTSVKISCSLIARLAVFSLCWKVKPILIYLPCSCLQGRYCFRGLPNVT